MQQGGNAALLSTHGEIPHIRRENSVSKSARFILGREICVSKSIGLGYSWKEIYVSNLQERFTETLIEDVDLSKTQPRKYFVYMDRENSSRE